MNLGCLQSVTQLYHLDSFLSSDQSWFQTIAGLEPIFYVGFKIFVLCPFPIKTKTLISVTYIIDLIITYTKLSLLELLGNLLSNSFNIG